MSEDYVKDGEYLPGPLIGEFLGGENAPLEVNQSTDAADVIRTTQGVRLKILKARMAKGVPTDDKALQVDLQLLRDLDTAALTTRKIDVEERAVNEAEAINQHTAALTKMFGGKSPFAIDPATGQVRADLQNRPIVAELPEPDLVPGIFKQGTDNLNYGDFVDDPDGDDERRASEMDSDIDSANDTSEEGFSFGGDSV